MRFSRAVAAMAVFLALGGCGHFSATRVAPPPAALLQPCPRPALEGPLNGDLARAFLLRGQAIDACNDDKAALREWAAKRSKGKK
jgi:hypothetical protein